MIVVLLGLSLASVVLAWTVEPESFATPRYSWLDLNRDDIERNRENLTWRRAETERRERFKPQPDCILRVYDADKEADIIRQWHDLVKNPIEEETAMRQLLIEACDDDDKKLESMCLTFLMAKSANLCVPGLMRAECVAVTMYTIEEGGFYREFNNASAYGIWEPYRVYTTLLLSAVKKLAAIEPVSVNRKLYRGMHVTCSPPNAKRLFWKTFTSTSLDPEVALYFGSSTFYEFQKHATFFGAQIKNLSLMGFEEEVLIPPFEMFDFVKAEDQKFYFSASLTQDLLHGHAADHFRSAQAMTKFTAVVSIVIVAMLLQ